MGITVAINHIELVEKLSGKLRARIIGKRITVHEIASMIAIGGSSIEWVLENFDLTPAEIHAALAFYYDHKEQIEREIAEDEAYVRQNAISADEHLAQMRSRVKPK